jgi:hypothetical protein
VIITDSDPTDWTGPTNSPGEWHMVTLTCDGINAPLIYIDGKVSSPSNPFRIPASSTNYLVFGHEANSDGNNDFDGDMWLPQIWSTNLSPANIANLYYREKNGIPWP